MQHKMKLLEKPFNNILDGSKEIEFRLYDEKRSKIKFQHLEPTAKRQPTESSSTDFYSLQ